MKKPLLVGGTLLALGAVVIGLAVWQPWRQPFHASGPASKEVQALIDDLNSWNHDTKLRALDGLAEKGPEAEAAVPALVDLIKRRDEDVRLHSAMALGKVGRSALPPLTELLHDRDADVRYYGVWAIGLMGPDPVVPDPPRNPEESALKQRLQDKDREVIKLLADHSDQVRRKAAWTLGQNAPGAAAAAPALVPALGDNDEDVRQAAADALARLGPPAVPFLVDALKGTNAQARAHAASALATLGPAAEKAVPALVPLLKDPDAGLRSQAIQPLTKVGKAAVPPLGDALQDADETTRGQLLQALGQVGVEAVPVLVDGLKDPRADVRRGAAAALTAMNVDDKLVVLALAAALEDKDPTVRQSAVTGLYNLGPSAAPAAAALGRVLTDAKGDNNLRYVAVLTLERIRPLPADAVEALNRAAKDDPDFNVKQQAQHVLQLLRPRP
jgi:HEAT repeat protein